MNTKGLQATKQALRRKFVIAFKDTVAGDQQDAKNLLTLILAPLPFIFLGVLTEEWFSAGVFHEALMAAALRMGALFVWGLKWVVGFSVFLACVTAVIHFREPK